MRENVTAQITLHWKTFLFTGAALAVMGVLAIAIPLISKLAVEIFVGWLFFIGGILRVVSVFSTKHVPGYRWSMLVAIIAIALGLILVMRPLHGILTLTIVLTALFFVEGVSAIFSAFDFRHHNKNWSWLFFSGLVDFLLVYFVWQGWPETSLWVIGVLTGVNLLFLGLSLVMTSLAARQNE